MGRFWATFTHGSASIHQVATQLWAITLSTLDQLAIATRAIPSDRSYSVVNYRRTLNRATMDINTRVIVWNWQNVLHMRRV